jgi:hypothetical protein
MAKQRIEISELERKKLADAGRKSITKIVKKDPPMKVTVPVSAPQTLDDLVMKDVPTVNEFITEAMIVTTLWQSINTAPRNGSKFVIWLNGEPAICYYDTNVNQWYLDGAGRIVHPTHWHPVEPLELEQ